MARPHRRSARYLSREIRDNAPAFEFFQAVRLLALDADGASNLPAVPAKLRFASPLTLSFQASEIAGMTVRRDMDRPDTTGNNASPINEDPAQETPAENSPPKESSAPPLDMTVGFMGMTGPSGVLPVVYTELMIDRRNQYRDTTAHRFLDLFTHRSVSLFYKAWRKHRFYLSFEAGNPDGFSRNLLDLVGVGLRNLQSRLETNGIGIPDRFLIHYAGLLSQKPMSGVNLAAIVRGFFGVEVQLESYVGRWIVLPTEEQGALGEKPCLLGQTALLGERIWDMQTKIGLKIGPLNREQFDQFMPGQKGLFALRELVQFGVGTTLDCDLTIILNKNDIPSPVLAARTENAPRLGYSLWLNSRPPEQHSQDVRFALLNEEATV